MLWRACFLWCVAACVAVLRLSALGCDVVGCCVRDQHELACPCVMLMPGISRLMQQAQEHDSARTAPAGCTAACTPDQYSCIDFMLLRCCQFSPSVSLSSPSVSLSLLHVSCCLVAPRPLPPPRSDTHATCARSDRSQAQAQHNTTTHNPANSTPARGQACVRSALARQAQLMPFDVIHTIRHREQMCVRNPLLCFHPCVCAAFA